MKLGRTFVSSLLLAMIAGLSACGGGGGGGEDTIARPVTDSATKPGAPGDAAQVPPPAAEDPPEDSGSDGQDNAGPNPDPGPAPEQDPPPPPPLESVCAQAIDRCIDLNGASIARYLGGKTAAASYTFDDGYVSSETIAGIFEDFGWRASFYIVPGTVEALTGWDYWKEIAARGHEIGNHSMTHQIELNDPALSERTLMTEIVDARNLIEERLGLRPQTMAFPWHFYSSKALEIALGTHFSVRRIDIGESNYEFAFFDTAHQPTLDRALATANAQLTRMVNEDGWLVAGGHGVDGDGWSPVTSQFLRDHLAHARQHASRLWVDTYANVARYRACRDQVTPAVYTSTPGKAVVTLNGRYDANVCTAPLTVAIPLRLTPGSGYTVTDGAGQALAGRTKNGQLLVDLAPGETATVEVLAMPVAPVDAYR